MNAKQRHLKERLHFKLDPPCCCYLQVSLGFCKAEGNDCTSVQGACFFSLTKFVERRQKDK